MAAVSKSLRAQSQINYIQTFTALLSAGMIVVLAFVWQDIIQEIFVRYFPEQASLHAKILGAIVLTIFVIVLVVWLDSRYNVVQSPILGLI